MSKEPFLGFGGYEVVDLDPRVPLAGGLLKLRLPSLLVYLSPFLLGPPELFHGGGEVQEVDGNDRGARPQISVADKGIQFTASFD
jgi:hypothetical protein